MRVNPALRRLRALIQLEKCNLSYSLSNLVGSEIIRLCAMGAGQIRRVSQATDFPAPDQTLAPQESIVTRSLTGAMVIPIGKRVTYGG